MLFRKKKADEGGSKVPIIGEKEFQDFISSRYAVLDCYNEHCVPCRRIHPMIEELAGKYPEISFGKLNTDYSVEIAVKYGVMSVPTILIFRDGELVGSMKDVKSIKHLEDTILDKLEVKR